MVKFDQLWYSVASIIQ